MAHEIKFDREKGLVRVRHFGDVDGKDLREGRREVVKLVQGKDRSRMLIDLRDTKLTSSVVDELGLARPQGGPHKGVMKVAVLVRKDRYGGAPPAADPADGAAGNVIRVFDTEAEALRWLEEIVE
ncbi:MAG: STAS/SEC14 domain-containing protein [Candidatus Edwardsbacteria bacterium]|jgi:hypothetical protein|nr:STAS/SEC14 domain-containing protein [Candidatus Edwardsbacteria bacterium]